MFTITPTSFDELAAACRNAGVECPEEESIAPLIDYLASVGACCSHEVYVDGGRVVLRPDRTWDTDPDADFYDEGNARWFRDNWGGVLIPLCDLTPGDSEALVEALWDVDQYGYVDEGYYLDAERRGEERAMCEAASTWQGALGVPASNVRDMLQWGCDEGYLTYEYSDWTARVFLVPTEALTYAHEGARTEEDWVRELWGMFLNSPANLPMCS